MDIAHIKISTPNLKNVGIKICGGVSKSMLTLNESIVDIKEH